MTTFSDVLLWSLWVVVMLVSTGWSTFCPVTSPLDEVVYVTDRANSSSVVQSKAECAMKCAFYAALNHVNDVNCRCFNYNSTSLNCSLFHYEPTSYALDQSQATVAYQVAENKLKGLWPTVSQSQCFFPFMHGGQVYTECRHSVVDDRHCAADYYSCYLPSGCPAFCLAEGSSSAAMTTTAGQTPYPIVEAGNCSYPFTYNGVVYYSCIQNMVTSNTRHCAPFACLRTNKTVERCYLSTGFMAQTTQTSVVIGNQPSIPVLSVFGWIVFMQSTGQTFNWNLTWAEYKSGFGSAGGDFWLGLERVHLLTSSAKYRLRVEVLRTSDGYWLSAEYWSFVVGDEATSIYQLNIAGNRTDQQCASVQCSYLAGHCMVKR